MSLTLTAWIISLSGALFAGWFDWLKDKREYQTCDQKSFVYLFFSEYGKTYLYKPAKGVRNHDHKKNSQAPEIYRGYCNRQKRDDNKRHQALYIHVIYNMRKGGNLIGAKKEFIHGIQHRFECFQILILLH